MALKTDRIHVDSQIDYFMNATAERGGIVAISTVGSGSAMDQAQQLCTYAATTSGIKPLGVLMCDVVNNDLLRQHENWHKEEVQIGGKVTIWSKCTVVTNRIYGTPTAGSLAYVGPSGLLAGAAYQADHTGAAARPVGRFVSSKDEEGYAKVQVNLP